MIFIIKKTHHPLRIFLLIIIIIVNFVIGHREHKVHNITLYPDKHSWCHVLPIKQVISYTGCKSVEIDNNVCVGACFSYSIPHTEPSDPGEVIVPYCDSCQPSETEWHHVQLKCDDKNLPDNVGKLDEFFIKRVQIIKNCSCISCEMDKYIKEKLLGYNNNHNIDGDNNDNDNLLYENNDIPDLLNILQMRNETILTKNSTATTNNNNDLKLLLNHHIITLLKNIQSDNLQKDKEQLINALRIVQLNNINNNNHHHHHHHHNNNNNNNNNDDNIAKFVNSLNTENIELDIPHLKDILYKYEQSKNYDKLHSNHHNHHHQQQLNDDQENDTTTTTILSSPSSPSTISSIATTINDIKEKNDNDNQHQLLHHHHHHLQHHHHHVDENIEENHHHHHGHLIRGPHNSLIIKPDNNNDNNNDKLLLSDKHEKLDVNPHELKPNHAGTLLSYSSHSSSDNSQNKNLK